MLHASSSLQSAKSQYWNVMRHNEYHLCALSKLLRHYTNSRYLLGVRCQHQSRHHSRRCAAFSLWVAWHGSRWFRWWGGQSGDIPPRQVVLSVSFKLAQPKITALSWECISGKRCLVIRHLRAPAQPMYLLPLRNQWFSAFSFWSWFFNFIWAIKYLPEMSVIPIYHSFFKLTGSRLATVGTDARRREVSFLYINTIMYIKYRPAWPGHEGVTGGGGAT